jgi:hypothetical protein
VYEKRSILKCNIGYRFEAVRGGQRGKRKDLEVLMGRKLKFCWLEVKCFLRWN